VKSFGSVRMTKPKELERIPLRYENAFGGWDHAHSAPDQSQFEPRNPVGTGFRSRWNAGEDSVRLPNVEDPSRLIRRLQDRPPPAGFGFTTACWQPRAALAGTFDDFWMRERMPLLPFDFDRRYFNGASQGLTAPHYLKGDEVVTVVNVSPNGKTEFRLPGTAAPRVRVELRGHHEEVLQTNLDTVVVNLEENLLLLIWRAHLVSRGTPQDVVSVVVDSDDFPAPVTIG
jgi:hypothetical protein